MTPAPFYPIGVPGQRWGEIEHAQWRSRQQRQRLYANDVLARIEALRHRYEIVDYGSLHEGGETYPLRALRSLDWRDDRPVALVTGGVHGYETSGVHGALAFLEGRTAAFEGCNLLVVPCVSPWAYEHIQRWNPHAIDPNRSFHVGGAASESTALMSLVAPFQGRVAVHVDLHETTDSDESEFRPALAARDGKTFEPDAVPDGFYVVGDTANPQLEFQQAIITAVAMVTHIAPADAQGKIIGSDVVAPGVILYPMKSLALCGGLTDAPFTTTTEVYPDSARVTAAQCNAAQVAAVVAALDYALAQGA